MNIQEAIDKYGKIPLVFSNYYKYSFGFVGMAPDGARIYMSIGGDSGDIYRLNIGRDKEFFLDQYCNYARITMNEEEIFSYSNY